MINISYIEHTEPLNSDNMWVTLNNWKNTDISFDNLHKLVGNSNIQYSPYSFTQGKKIAENWNNDKQNLLIFDIDEGLNLSLIHISEPTKKIAENWNMINKIY